MADFDELLKTMHEHGLKLIMDLVVNHCSSEVGVSRSCLLRKLMDDTLSIARMVQRV